MNYLALRRIEWENVVFPDVNMLVHVNVNVPEKRWSHALKASLESMAPIRVSKSFPAR
jgi:hypothetical protein